MKSSQDLVSVVIPIYNSEKFLNECLLSVLNQSYENLEIIGINDGSTDHSLEILEKLSDKITIISQSNKGLAAAIQNGIKKINGKWFKWISPDDVLYPQAIELLVKQAKKLQENIIVYSNWDIIDQGGKKLRSFSESNYNDLDNFDFNIRLLDGQQINVNTTLIPTSLFEKGCTIRTLMDPVAIDYDFFLRAGILYDVKFHLISKPLVKYRINPEQLSHKNISKTLSYIETIRNEVLSQLDISRREKYSKALKKYQQEQPISKKTMKTGLKLMTYTLPNWATDRILTFYLNRIRRAR